MPCSDLCGLPICATRRAHSREPLAGLVLWTSKRIVGRDRDDAVDRLADEPDVLGDRDEAVLVGPALKEVAQWGRSGVTEDLRVRATCCAPGEEAAPFLPFFAPETKRSQGRSGFRVT